MSSERIGQELEECAEFLGWGDLETTLKVLDRIQFWGWAILAVTIFLALRHKHLARKRFGKTLGQQIDEKLNSRRRQNQTLPPPTVESTKQEGHSLRVEP